MPAIDRQFLVERQGRQFVLYAGLLDLAHQQGLKAIRTRLLQIPSEDNNLTAIVQAEIETERGTFTGIGDANPSNVSRQMLTCTIRMAECVPVRAEILTRDGWRHHDQIAVGQEVLAYDVTSDRCRWVMLEAVTVYSEPHPTYQLDGRSFHAICTPQHTWATQNSGRRQLVQTDQLRSGDSIIVAAPAEGGNHPLTPRDAAILGWVMTDGTMRSELVAGRYGPYCRMHIDQSKPMQVGRIRELLGSDATEVVTHPPPRTFPNGKTYQLRPSHRFSLSSRCVKRLLSQIGEARLPENLPGIVLQLSQPARASMFEAMLLADGTRRIRTAASWEFGKKRKPGVMEAFELLATLEGRALGRPRWSSGGIIPVRTVRSNRVVTVANLEIADGEVSPVWCPTTPLGTWIMRLDGQISITGNTRAKARALRDAVNVGVAAVEEQEDSEEPAAPRSATPPAATAPPSPHPTQPAPAARPTAAPSPKPAAARPSSGEPMATEAQVRAIYSIAETEHNCTAGQTDERCREQFGAVPADLTRKQASELITRLKGGKH